MITQIKRSIPDLRSIKHQPLQNKESPLGSPRASHCRLDIERNQHSSHHSHSREYRGHIDKDTDAITLSAVAVRTCTCGASKEATAEKNQNPDESDAFAMPHSSSQQATVELRYN